METDHIRYIRCVAEHANISAAAREMGITQSALTKIVSRVEDVVGAKLFDRGTRGVRLTPIGSIFLDRMAVVDQEILNLATEIKASQRGVSGTIRVGVGQFWLGKILPKTIATLSRFHPSIQVKIHTGARQELFAKLRKGELDYILGRITDDLPPEFSGEALAEVRLFLVMREGHPALAEPGGITPATLDRFKWILPPPADPTIDATFIEHDLEPPVAAVEAVSRNLVFGLLQAGDYVTIMPEITTSQHTDGLVRLEADWLGWSRHAGVIGMKHRALLPCCERFLTFLRAEMNGA